MLLRANGNLFTCKIYCFHMLYILLLCIQELSSFENTPLLVSLRLSRLFLLHALVLAVCPWGYLGLGIMPMRVTLALDAYVGLGCVLVGLPWPWQRACLGLGSVPMVTCLGLGCVPNGTALALAACPWGLAHFQNVLKSDHWSLFQQ